MYEGDATLRGVARVENVSYQRADTPAAAALGLRRPAAGGHSVGNLVLTDFRGYRCLRLVVDPRPVVLAGPNGAGKTNVLEAISFLVPGRGLRRARLGDVVRQSPSATDEDAFRARAWSVAARVDGSLGPVRIGTGWEEGSADGGRERRRVRVDGSPVKGQSALAAYLSAQWLTPHMDRLFTDSPAVRRRFLDRMVSAFDPSHAERVSAYDHAQSERGRLLAGDRRFRDDRWLAALEEAMGLNGVAIAAARMEAAARLSEACARGRGPFPGAEVRLAGTVDEWLLEMPAVFVEDRLRAVLAASREDDARAGRTASGPHRSDLRVTHLDTGRPAELCSTGEQKALLMSLVLAHARVEAEETGWAPLLLLDEVAAHLDEARREALFGELLALGGQAWLTGTDAALFSPLSDAAQVFRVEDARVSPVH